MVIASEAQVHIYRLLENLNSECPNTLMVCVCVLKLLYYKPQEPSATAATVRTFLPLPNTSPNDLILRECSETLIASLQDGV